MRNNSLKINNVIIQYLACLGLMLFIAVGATFAASIVIVKADSHNLAHYTKDASEATFHATDKAVVDTGKATADTGKATGRYFARVSRAVF